MRENVSSCTVQSRILALFLVFAMMIGVCPAALATGESTVSIGNPSVGFVGDAIASDKTALTNNEFGINISAAFNYDSAGFENPQLRLYIGDMDVTSFISFENGGKFTDIEPYIADGIKYSVQKDENGEKYILLEKWQDGKVQPWVAGDTVATTLSARFDGNAKNGSEWDISLKIYDENGNLKNETEPDKITSKSDVEMNNTKSVNLQNIMLPTVDSETVLGEDIEYTLKAFTGAEPDNSRVLKPGETKVNEYVVTDTFTLPNGIYITGKTEEDIRKALEADFNYTISDIQSSENGISGFTLNVTKTNDSNQQIENFEGTVKIKGDNVIAGSDFKNQAENKAIITNKISTSYKTVNSPVDAISTTPAEVTTNVYRPKVAGYTKVNKKIENKISDYNTDGYVTGDYVLYKISFTNSGDEEITGGTITDTLPEGLTPVTSLKDMGLTYESDFYQKVNHWNCNGSPKLYNGACVHKGSVSEISINENVITFNGVSVSGKSDFEGYVLAKITGDVTEDTIRTNTAKVGEAEVSASFTQKPKTANISISKSVKNDTKNNSNKYEAGDKITYTVTVKNDGTADAENVKVTDLFPENLFENIAIDGKSVVTNDSDKTQTKTYDLGTVIIPANSSKIFTITGTVKNGVTDKSIVNTAKAEYNDNTVTANATLNWDNPASYVEIKKSGDKDGQYAKAGDTVEYTISLNTDGKTFTNDVPLKVRDVVPAGLTVSGIESTGNLEITYTNEGQEYTFTAIGTGTAEIKIKCTIDEGVEDMREIKNTAYVIGGASTGASSGSFIVGSANQFPVEKTAEIWRNGAKVGDIASGATGHIEPGDTLKFKIKVTNNSGADVTELLVNDSIDGIYQGIQAANNAEVVIKVTSITGDNVDGLGKAYDYRQSWDSQDIYTEQGRAIYLTGNKVYYPYSGYEKASGQILFIKDYDANKTGNARNHNYYYNPEFTMHTGGSIIIECEAVFGTQNMCESGKIYSGSNSAWVGNDTPSTVKYTTEEVATPTPSMDPDATAAPTPEATVDPYMPTLKIEKSVSQGWGNAATNDIIFKDDSDLSGYASNDIIYDVKISNISEYDYVTDDACILDQLPKQMGLKFEGSNGSPVLLLDGWSSIITNEMMTLYVGDVPENGDYTKDEYWNTYKDAAASVNKNYGDAMDHTWIAVKLCNDKENNTFTVRANTSFTIRYILKLKSSAVEDIKAEIEENGEFAFETKSATNTAYFTGSKQFKNTDNKPTNVISATKTVTLRAETIHPGIKKTAFAYIDKTMNSFAYKSDGAKPGVMLIWKLQVRNDKDTNEKGKEMTKYTLTDILPAGYKYTEGQTYTNSDSVSYPSSLEGIAADFKNGKMIKHTADGETKELEFMSPKIDEDTNTLVWEFDGGDYKLQPGEYIEFLILTEPIKDDSNTEYKSGVYYNKAVLEAEGKFYEDTVKVGTVENGNITDGDSFSINTVLTSGEISVKTADGQEAVGGTENNVAAGKAGEKVKYTLKVSNDDNTEIKNVSIINRIPYVGDSGVIVSGQRGSEFDVKFAGSLKVTVHRADGTEEVLDASNYTFTTYSGDSSKVFDEVSKDWDTKDLDGWTDNWDSSTKLVRIMIGNDNNPITLAKGEYITVSYDAELPAQGADEDKTAWNGFAYHYDSNNTTDMAAEPASVGVTLPKNDTLTGKISVKKTLSSPDNTPRTFYVAIYDKQYEEGVQPLSVKSITLTGGNVKHPVNAEIEFDNLTYTAIGKDVKYYIYETDENGIPLIQNKSGNGFVMCKGFYRTDKGSYNVVYNSDETNKVDDVTPSDEKNVDMVWATDKTGSNKVEHIITGHYCFWEKGLNETKTINSANFTNCIEETKVERQISVKGPYYSDIATSFEALSKIKSGDAADDLTTGVVIGRTDLGIERDERDNNDDADRKITYSYDSGNKITKSQQYDFGNGWGNAEGHTVATGFMATITGGTNDEENIINEVMWDVKSEPAKNDVYVKLAESEYAAFSDKIAGKGYSLTSVFTDDVKAHNSIIYKIEKSENQESLTNSEDAVDMDNTAEDESSDSFGNETNTNTKLNEDGDSIGFDSDEDVSDRFGDDDYSSLAESEDVKPLHWKITDKIPAVTLGNGTTVNIGIIIDQIYDNSAVGDFTVNPLSEDSESATSADSAKITPYGPQSDVPAYNFSGIYAAEGIKNVLSPLEAGDNITLGKSYFGFDGDIRSIRANIGDKKQVMICAGAYQESNSSGKLTYKNDVTVSDEYVRVGSYNNSKSSYLVSGQPAPAIAVKIPAGGVKLTINAASGGSDTRYLTIYESNGNGGFKEIREISREGKATVLKAEKNGGTSSINISANSDKVVYITSTGSNINIKSIGVSLINN